MSPIVRECQKKKIDFFILHTGQHYSKELDEIMFKELEMPAPKYNLGVGGQPYRKQVGIMTKEIINIFKEEKPDVVLVQGDTISVLAGALAASKLGIKLAHHEAGLRSHDTSMLEEVNRVIVDHISDFLFVPTSDALKNLHQEGGDSGKIVLTGNTIVDAVNQNLEIADKKINVLKNLNLTSKKYILVTCHRAESVDKKEILEEILKGFSRVFNKFNLPLIFPVHPRTMSKMEEFNLTFPTGIRVIEPVGFLEMLQLERNARLIITDSGGIQEEAFVLKVPCVTIRTSTERPETIACGANFLAGTDSEGILSGVEEMMEKNLSINNRENPFGDGKAAERIINELVKRNL